MTGSYGVYPEAQDVIEDGESGVIVVRNRFYEVAHSLKHGGAVCSIRLLHAGGENLLTGVPCGGELAVAGAAKSFAPGAATQVEVRRGPEPTLVFRTPLTDADGRDCGVVLTVSYEHRWGHVRVRQTLEFPDAGLEVRRLLLHRWVLTPELTHVAIRPNACLDGAASPHYATGDCHMGRFAPGSGFNRAYQSRFVPRYVGFATPGRQGLEWFVGSDLAQWDYQLTGAPGRGSLRIEPRTAPPAVVMSVCALDLPMGGVKVRGRQTFDSTIGIPVISGRAHTPFLNKSFRRGCWPADADVADWARRGIRTAHFHHDGDSNRDGIFWRDGAYPPFEPADMREYDRVVAACRRNGIRVATYFSNKELHPSVQAFKDHGTEWARLADDRRQVLHNAAFGGMFGAQMCLRSGWLDWFKAYVDKVLAHHDLDGVYYDWNVPLYCHNPAHADGVVAGANDAPRKDALGTWEFSPEGHWDVDELLDLMQWTRQRVGPDGLCIVHSSSPPMAALENYVDFVAVMEGGYSKLATGAPALDELPLEWNFMGARSRGVIGYGCLEASAPARVHRQMTLRCLLAGAAPWPALDLDLEMFAPLAGREFSRFVFHDWRNRIAAVRDTGAATAVYRGADRMLVLVGDLEGRARETRCTVDAGGGALGAHAEYRITTGGCSVKVGRDELMRTGVPVKLPADDVATIEIEPG